MRLPMEPSLPSLWEMLGTLTGQTLQCWAPGVFKDLTVQFGVNCNFYFVYEHN